MIRRPTPKRGRRRSSIVLLGLFLLHAGAGHFRDRERMSPGQSALALPVQRYATGGRATLGEIAGGRPLLMIFWTSWCPYCTEQLAAGVGLAERLATGPTPVETLFINVGEHRVVVADRVAGGGLDGRIALDGSGRIARFWGVDAFPAYVLVDAEGRRRWIRRGLVDDVAGEVGARLALDGAAGE